MQNPYLQAGEFVTTHGVDGTLRLYPQADEPSFLTQFDTFYLGADGREKLSAEQVRVHKNICLVKLKNIDTVQDAKRFIGRNVYIHRDDAALPQGHFFIQDLIGGRVIDAETGRLYGEIKNITRPSRHDVYEVVNDAGETFLFPGAEPFIDRVDLDEKALYVRPIDGMFEPLPKSKKAARNQPQNPPKGTP